MWRCLVKRQIRNWQDELDWASKNWRVRLFGKICRLTWAATFYCIWMDTNIARIHNGKIRSGTELLNGIFFAVKSRISTCRNLKKTIQNKVLPSLCRIPSYLCLYLKPISCSYCIRLLVNSTFSQLAVVVKGWVSFVLLPVDMYLSYTPFICFVVVGWVFFVYWCKGSLVCSLLLLVDVCFVFLLVVMPFFFFFK